MMSSPFALTENDYPIAQKYLEVVGARYAASDFNAQKQHSDKWDALHKLRLSVLAELGDHWQQRGMATDDVARHKRLLTLAMLEHELTQLMPLHMKGWLNGFETRIAGGAYAAFFAPWHDHLDRPRVTKTDMDAVHNELWHHFPGYATWRKIDRDAASGIEDVVLGEELTIYQDYFSGAPARASAAAEEDIDAGNYEPTVAHVRRENIMTDHEASGSGWIAAFVAWNVLALVLAVPIAVVATYLQINGHISDDIAGAMIYILSPVLATGLMISVRQSSGMSFVDWLTSLPWLQGPTRRWLGVAAVAAMTLLIYAGFAGFNGTPPERVGADDVAQTFDAPAPQVQGSAAGEVEAALTDNDKKFEKEGAAWLGLE